MSKSKTVRISEEYDEKVKELQVDVAKEIGEVFSKKEVVEYAIDYLEEKLQEENDD